MGTRIVTIAIKGNSGDYEVDSDELERREEEAKANKDMPALLKWVIETGRPIVDRTE